LHLTATAAAKRSDEFGQQIQKWDFWTRGELDQAIAALKKFHKRANHTLTHGPFLLVCRNANTPAVFEGQ